MRKYQRNYVQARKDTLERREEGKRERWLELASAQLSKLGQGGATPPALKVPSPINPPSIPDEFWRLLGRPGGQEGAGGTGSGQSATLYSTTHGIKGKVFLGLAKQTAYDEVNERFGVNAPSPAARIHARHTTGGGTQITHPFNTSPTTPADYGGSWGVLGGPFPNALQTNDGDTSFVQSGTSINFDMYVRMNAVSPAPLPTDTVTMKVIARRGTGLSIINGVTLYMAVGIPAFGGSPDPVVVPEFVPNSLGDTYATYSYTLSATEITNLGAWNNVFVGFRCGLSNTQVINITEAWFESPAGYNTLPLHRFEASSLSVTNDVNYAQDGGGGTDLALTGASPLMLTVGGGSSGIRLRTSGTDARIEAGSTAGANLNLILSGNRAVQGTLLTIDFANALFKGPIRLEDPGAGTNYIAHQAPTTPTTHTLTWPGAIVDQGFLRVATGGALSWVTLSASSFPHVLLDSTVHTDTVTQTVSRGSLIYGNATPKWDELTVGAANTVVASDGTDTAFRALSTLTSAEFLDSAFRIIGAGDNTKKFAFEVDTITTATTRTVTVKDASGTLPLLETTNAWTSTNQWAGTSTFATTGSVTMLGSVTLGSSSTVVAPTAYWPLTSGGAGINISDGEGGVITGALHVPPLAISSTWTLPKRTGSIIVWNGSAGDLPTAGRLLYGAGVTTAMTSLAIGAADTILTSTGSAPQWSTNASVVDVARTWTTLQTFKDTTIKIVDDADATKTLVWSLGGATAGADLTLAWSGTVDRTITYPNGTGTIALLSGITEQEWTATNIFADARIGTASIYGQFDPSSLTTPRFFTFPDADGIIVLTGGAQTLLSKTLSTGTVLTTSVVARVSTSSTGFSFTDNTTTSKAFRFILSGLTASTNNTFTLTGTAVRDWKWEDVPGSMVVAGNGADPPATDAIGRVNRTAQTAAIAATNLTNSTPAGYYIVDFTIEDTTADVTAGTIQFQINYTDDVGATNQTGAALVLTATGRDRGSFQVYLASGNITYQTNLVGSIGTAQYALRVRCTFLG